MDPITILSLESFTLISLCSRTGSFLAELLCLIKFLLFFLANGTTPKVASAKAGVKAKIKRSGAVDALLKDEEFMHLIPAFEDKRTVVSWIDRLYKGMKDTNVLSKDACRAIAREAGADDGGSKKMMIVRIMGTDMYDSFPYLLVFIAQTLKSNSL
jgi:hypothetical protein